MLFVQAALPHGVQLQVWHPIPGLAPAEGTPDSLTTFRLFSQRSLGVSDRGWQAQRDSLTVYAVAYNWTVRAARVPPSTRPL